MEKRLLQAFLITIIFLIVWSYMMPKQSPQQPVPQEVSEEIVHKEEIITRESLPEEIVIKEEGAELPQAAIGEFIITYSPTGGYIKSIFLGTAENGLPFKNIGYTPQDKDKQFSASIQGNKIIFRGPQEQRKEFIFKEHTLEIRLSPPLPALMILLSNYLQPNMLDQRYQELFYSQKGLLKRSGAKKVKEGEYSKVDFAGARDRYYCASLVKGSYDVKWAKENNTAHLYLISPPSSIMLYIGPQTEKALKPYGLQGVIYYGIFHFIATLMIKLLYLLHFLTKSWGLSIILFSVLVYLTLFPLTAKSTKAMRRMQQIQPEIEALKEKYKDNPQKMQKETMELYRKYKINPLGGCLPLFFQFPVFFALYQALLRLVDLKGAHFLWIKDLTLPDRLFLLPFTIPLLNAKYFNLLPILVMVLGLIQQKVMSPSTAPSQQKSMGLFMSVFIGFIFYKFPSALVLYWFTQNLLTLVYQARLTRVRATQPEITA